VNTDEELLRKIASGGEVGVEIPKRKTQRLRQVFECAHQIQKYRIVEITNCPQVVREFWATSDMVEADAAGLG
jgi:hypothetical protein